MEGVPWRGPMEGDAQQITDTCSVEGAWPLEGVLQVCGLCMGVLYVLACRVSTVSGAFGLFFAINIFSSCAEMMLGALLMELAHHGKRSAEDGQGNGGGGGGGSMMQDAGAIQALAGGTRSLGSVSAVRAFVCACMWANLPVLFSKIFPPIY